MEGVKVVEEENGKVTEEKNEKKNNISWWITEESKQSNGKTNIPEWLYYFQFNNVVVYLVAQIRT